MNNPPEEGITDGGEVGLYSLNKAVTTNFAINQDENNDGVPEFFRPDAALSIIFVSDENDICSGYQPPIHVPATGPASVPDNNHKEYGDPSDPSSTGAYGAYCSGISPASVMQNVRNINGTLPLLITGIVYDGTLPVTNGSENELGYGYFRIDCS